MTDKISPAQVRGARGMLDWSMATLSKAAGVSVSTIKRVEDGGLEAVSDTTVAVIQDALEMEGVRFLSDDGHGVGLRCKAE